MTNITVVTTFHKPGLDLYAQKFIDSFSKHVDKKIKLVAFAENCNPSNPDPAQIRFIDSSIIKKLTAFKEKYKNDPRANGDISNDPVRSKRKDADKKFKWDAIRFANKVYSVLELCKIKPSSWIVWMDADTLVHSDWSYEDFKNLLPDTAYITYVGRGKGSQTWPECGFYGLNLNHPVCHSFLEDFEQMYEDAENGIFTLDEWHDSYVFGEILKKYSDFPSYDYSADMYLREAKSGGGGHPLINGPLGAWIDHMKGGRKYNGKSNKTDIMVKRSENYWQ